jgi:hypothetical protein
VRRPDHKFIVQDRESGLFLTPVDGDVGYTKWAHEAGRFDEAIEAVDTANLVCSSGYFVTEVVG